MELTEMWEFIKMIEEIQVSQKPETFIVLHPNWLGKHKVFQVRDLDQLKAELLLTMCQFEF